MSAYSCTAVPKNNKKNYSILKSFRPIQVQQALSKILEKSTLLLHVKSNLFSTQVNQFGYKQGCSTQVPITLLNSATDPFFVSVIDMTSAFDCISWARIVDVLATRKKLNKTWIRFFYTSFSIETLIQWGFKKTTNPIKVTRGVKQGGLYSPNFFSLCLDELAIEMETIPYGVYLEKFNFMAKLFVYADDLLCLSRSLFGLRQQVKLIVAFCKKWAICLLMLLSHVFWSLIRRRGSGIRALF